MKNTSFISLNHISFHIPQLEKPILSEITYEIFPRDIIILLGSNGSGKSSLLKLLDGRYQATQGKIHFNPFYFSKSLLKKSFPNIATLSQHCDDSLFPSLTVLENYILIKGSKKNAATYLADFNINLPHKLDQLAGKLSGGEKQALALALCFIHPPQLLLLDEHTSALDPQSGEQLMKLTHQKIVEYGITCLLTTHDLEIALHYGNRVLALKQGAILHAINKKGENALNKEKLLMRCY